MPNEIVHFSRERREDMLTGALEGGSNYWYLLKEEAMDLIQKHSPRDGETPTVTRMINAIYAGASIPIHDIEDEDGEPLGSIDLKSMEEGEVLMFQKYARHYGDAKSEQDDAITSDVWFQLCVMKDVVYG